MDLTTTQLVDIARSKLLEIGTEILSDATLLIYANWTKQDINKRIFPASSILSATVNFTSGTGSLPSDFGTLYGSGYSNTTPFQEVTAGDFSSADGYAITVEGGSLKVYPTTTGSLTIKYYPKYNTLSAMVNPNMDSYFQELIVYGILFRAYEDLQDEEMSMQYESKYEKKLAQKLAAQSNYEEDNVRGGQLFNSLDLLGSSWESPNSF